MKNVFLITICLFSFSLFACENKTSSFDKLPKTAQEFVNTYFTDSKATTVKQDIEDGDYTVKLQNGIKIKFDQMGNWTEIENLKFLPKGIVNSNIYDYIENNYPNENIIEVERDYDGIDIKLSNRLELEFDPNGNFIKIDR